MKKLIVILTLYCIMFLGCAGKVGKVYNTSEKYTTTIIQFPIGWTDTGPYAKFTYEDKTQINDKLIERAKLRLSTPDTNNIYTGIINITLNGYGFGIESVNPDMWEFIIEKNGVVMHRERGKSSVGYVIDHSNTGAIWGNQVLIFLDRIINPPFTVHAIYAGKHKTSAIINYNPTFR